MARNNKTYQERQAYPVRIAYCVALSLLVAIGFFRLWPKPSEVVFEGIFDTNAQELIHMEEILPTRQARRRPPPPLPVTPVIVPDDVVLDDVQIELPDNLTTSDPGNEEGKEVEGDDVAVSGTSARPDSGPRAFRVVEPEYTRDAQRRKVRAEVVVEVLVNARGRVETARVVDRFLLDGKDNSEREQVALVGYGLEEAAIAAAQQWQFRPARQGGRVVSSLTRLTFSFGI